MNIHKVAEQVGVLIVDVGGENAAVIGAKNNRRNSKPLFCPFHPIPNMIVVIIIVVAYMNVTCRQSLNGDTLSCASKISSASAI